MTRPFTIITAPQRSEEWFAARLGRVTGSKASCVQMGEKTAGRNDYIVQLALERLTGHPAESIYVNAEMQRGIDLEPMARLRASEGGAFIRETGFLRHDSLMIGTSLDGDEDDFARLWELKCPKSTTHVKYLESRGLLLVKDYQPQLVHALYTTTSQDATIGSYDDRMPDGLDWVQREVRAQDLPLDEYDRDLRKFLGEVDAMEARLLDIAAKMAQERLAPIPPTAPAPVRAGSRLASILAGAA